MFLSPGNSGAQVGISPFPKKRVKSFSVLLAVEGKQIKEQEVV